MVSLTESSQSFCWTDPFIDSLSSYKIINASLLASVVVLFSYLGYLVFKQVANILWYNFVKSVEITSTITSCGDTRAYLLQWLQNNVETKSLPHINVVSNTRREEDGQTVTESNNNPRYATTHYFTYKGHWVLMSLYFIPNVTWNDTSYDSITLSTFRSQSWILEEIMEEVRLLFDQKSEDEEKTRFYFANDGYWDECGNDKRKRPMSSVILNESVFTKINGDVHEFLTTSKWYHDRGIPYRRGYLLYGPPGCGKSSSVRAIAGQINFNICILSLSAKKLNDDTLNNLMNSTPENCIILLDVDAAFPNRNDDEEDDQTSDKKKKRQSIETSDNGSGKVTLRGLLNALDGVASTEGRIIFLTTNYIDRLDPAMTRPGRVDLKVIIDFPDDDQLSRMFIRFYPDADVDTDAKEFVRKIRALKKSKVSMAMIQGHFMMHKYDYKEMMLGIEKYFEDQFFSIKN